MSLKGEKGDFLEGTYSGKYSPGNIPVKVYVGTALELLKSVFKGYGSNFDDALTQGDYKTLASFHENIFLFSGCKTVTQVKKIQDLILDDKGYVRPWREFKKEAGKAYDLFNENWLRAERSAALSLSQSAATWADIQDVKETFPFLEYYTKEDAHVRKSHGILNGTIKKTTSPFWSRYYPPIDWGCRCNVEQLSVYDEAKETKIPANAQEVPNPLFAGNPGKTGKVFNQKHPYFKVLDKYPYLRELVPDAPPHKKVIAKRAKPRTDKVKTKVKAIEDNPPFMDPGFNDWPVKIDKRIFKALRRETKLKTTTIKPTRTNGQESHYNPNTHILQINTGGRFKKSKAYRSKVVYHEVGHAIHHQNKLVYQEFNRETLTMESKYSPAFKSLRSNLSKLYSGDTPRIMAARKLDQELLEDYVISRNDDYFEDIIKPSYPGFEGSKEDFTELLTATLDTLGAITNGRFGQGHTKIYYRKGGGFGGAVEIFAHTMENNLGDGNPILKKKMPEAHELMRQYFVKEIEPLL